MGWADWMVVRPSVEEDLAIEKAARVPLHHRDTDDVRQLCSKLVRHSWLQEMMLRQAVGRIAELEAIAMANSTTTAPRRPWWRLW